MKRWEWALLALGALAGAGEARPLSRPAHPAPLPLRWVGSWATPQQIPEERNALPPDALRDATLRQVVHLSIGGQTLRVVLSNAFGTAPLHLTAAHIAKPSRAPGSIDTATECVECRCTTAPAPCRVS